MKLEKIFAKPFVKVMSQLSLLSEMLRLKDNDSPQALEGHTDSVKCMSIARKSVRSLVKFSTANFEKSKCLQSHRGWAVEFTEAAPLLSLAETSK